jgi:CRISPR/Cas system-associated exonuclease Cas4 (RecB family)
MSFTTASAVVSRVSGTVPEGASVQVVISTSAAARLAAADRFLQSHQPSTEIIVVGASRGAADDLVRDLARRRGATFGLTRFSLTELAAHAAAARGGGRVKTPGSHAATEAMAARAAFEAVEAGALSYFTPVARMPGFPRALARTLHELRLASIPSESLAAAGAGAADLGVLLARLETELDRAVVDDRASLFAAAAAAWRAHEVAWVGAPALLLDLTLDSPAEQAFVQAVVERSTTVLATVPEGDARARAAFQRMGAAVAIEHDPATPTCDLASLRQYVFTSERPPIRERTGDVRLFSAPGEGRETVEIVRRLLDEAGAGVRFDEMAILLRTPQHYLGLLEHAAARGGVPMYFDRGTRRPHPAGRAFIALLSCAVDGLSAKRFDEYLSLGQVPSLDARRSDAGTPVPPQDEVFGYEGYDGFDRDEGFGFDEFDSNLSNQPSNVSNPSNPSYRQSESDEAIVAGTLRAPWKWEELIVESAVVGGRTRQDGGNRWRRRLDGLASDYAIRIAELQREEPDSPRIRRYQRDLANLAHLRAFALPVIDMLASWPERTTWGEWIARFSTLAEAALWRPQRVLQVLADLRPMAGIPAVSLEEARDVLHDRLVTLDWDPPARRYGRVFVGTPHQARGRAFKVVFVPGLAERVVPQRPREDPLLLDDSRQRVSRDLVRQDDRGSAERLLLKIAIGAASERLYLSYPRMDVAETRARVPSFYALDVVRAMTGRVPDHRALAAEAAEESGASLAWPAPKIPARAIDDLEHDLAVLRPLLDAPDRKAVKGHAHYLLGLNESLRRSVISRWLRGREAWTPSDGLVTANPAVLAKHRLDARPYSLTALQRFSTCPYQFVLATIHRLQPWDEPEPLVRMDPLTRGSLFHKAQAEFFRAMDARGALPIGEAGVAEAVRTLDRVLDDVAAAYEEQLAPAIDRVWRDEIGEIRRDLGIWVRKLADERVWVPAYFELAFGLSDEGRDPRSLPSPVRLDGRFQLHGSIDLVEHRPDLDLLRVTDHKTGKNRSNADLIVGGGGTLQPVLYSAMVEAALGKRVAEGRLFYCTTAGGFGEHRIEMNDYTRAQGLQVLQIVDRAVERGFLVAAPNRGACAWCDFRPVCGPREEERTRVKKKDALADLTALRSMR